MEDKKEEQTKRRLKKFLPIILVTVLLLSMAFLLLGPLYASENNSIGAYKPGKYPEGASFADVADIQASNDEYYAAYNDENDPAHPVLDVKVKLFISNLGTRPGAPRPQNIKNEYPTRTSKPTATPKPTSTPSVTGIVNPGLKPNVTLPDIQLPELYITEPNVKSPQYTGEKYKLEWKYTAGRKVAFSVTFSTDGGNTFAELLSGITEQNCTLTFPNTPAKHCKLRVTAWLDGREYKIAETNEFALASEPEMTFAPIANYIDPQVQYVNMPGVRIGSDLGEPVWFKAANSAEGAAKMVWQLSETPFWGTKESFGKETGILASGEVKGSQNGEFSVDLKGLVGNLTDSKTDAKEPYLTKKSIYGFYMRVVALDGSGNCIGDPGRGLYFTYGASDIVANLNTTSFAENSQIAILVQTPYYDKWQWKRVSPDTLNRDLKSSSDMLLFAGTDGSKQGSDIIQKAVRVELQVATSPFTNASALGLITPDGLVYSYTDTAPDIGQSKDGYNYATPYFNGIEYKKFVPKKEELDAMGGIYYYVRALFYVPDSANPSLLRSVPSETMTIAYRATSATQNTVKKVTVKSNIPFVQFLRYQPVKWQAPDYDEYFEVTRHIGAEEMKYISIRNKKTGDFLIPYEQHCKLYGWTREQYQAKLEEMLPVGASFHYLKSDPGFWDEFFSLLKAIYTSVQQAYADAKNAVVSLVDYIPLLGDDAKEYLKKAARYAIDYGLASIGLPPSLPNLDKLAAGGMDYVMKVAVDEALKSAGVPADSEAAKEITEQVRKQVAEGMTEELKKALLAQQQNPFRADFLRLSTEKLYEPAYVDVLIANYSKTESSVEGTLGVTFGDHMEIYRPSVLSVPTLKPGESIVIRIYLDHERNKYDGYNQYFDEIYNGKSGKPFNMRVYTVFNLKDVKEAAKIQKLSPAPLPYVTEYVYDHGNYEFTRNMIPAEAITQADNSVNPSEYDK